MIFSVSNERIHWSLDFGPNSVILIVKDVLQQKTLSSQELLPKAWNLFLSQRQEIINNYLARIPITPKQQGMLEMREEVLSRAGA